MSGTSVSFLSESQGIAIICSGKKDEYLAWKPEDMVLPSHPRQKMTVFQIITNLIDPKGVSDREIWSKKDDKSKIRHIVYDKDRKLFIVKIGIKPYKKLENKGYFVVTVHKDEDGELHNHFKKNIRELMKAASGVAFVGLSATAVWLWLSSRREKEKETNSPNLRGLNWTGNSCYLDSALVAFFAVPTDFTDKLINMDLEKNPLPKSHTRPCGENAMEDLNNRKSVQTQLRSIALSIRGKGPLVENCTSLRNTLKNCPDTENYHGTEFADSGEFLTYILGMFPLNLAYRKTETYATNHVGPGEVPTDVLIRTSVTCDHHASIMQFVPMESLDTSPDNVKISSFLNIHIDSGELTEENLFKPGGYIGQSFKRRISISTLEYTPYLIFNMKRVGIDYLTSGTVFRRKAIAPDLEIKLPNGQLFALSAVVMYTGSSHYVCTVKYDSKWYYFDDRPDKKQYDLKEMASYADVVEKAKYNPNTNGTQYYYSPIGDLLPAPVSATRPC
jgi:hypothetical protein